MAERIVVALGGNALGGTPERQLALVRRTAKPLADLVERGCELVIGHGNGPQVGMLQLATDYAAMHGGGTPSMPLCECGAMTQGYIGYHLQQALGRELRARGIERDCVCLVTQVVVDPKDPGFENPTKPVGGFYTREEAARISREKGWRFVEDAGRGYRRVVPSPTPLRTGLLNLNCGAVSFGCCVLYLRCSIVVFDMHDNRSCGGILSSFSDLVTLN